MKRYIILLSTIIFFYIDIFGENKDERRQTTIRDFISYYKEAYQRKDIDYISQVFSNDALILTETKKLKSIGKELIPKTSKKRPYSTIVDNRNQYISKLGTYFDKNGKIELGISNLRIEKHMKYDGVYGVNFFQIWDDVGKSNILENRMPGYIFLLIDFRKNEMEPTIHVRTWQPKSNIKKNSEKYQLSDFRIITTK